MITMEKNICTNQRMDGRDGEDKYQERKWLGLLGLCNVHTQAVGQSITQNTPQSLFVCGKLVHRRQDNGLPWTLKKSPHTDAMS